MKLFAFLPFLSRADTQTCSFPPSTCKKKQFVSPPPHRSLLCLRLICAELGTNNVPIVFNLVMEKSSQPHLSHHHPITFSWTRSLANGTVILQQSYDWINKLVHPHWWFHKFSSGWVSYFLRLKGVGLFLSINSFMNSITLNILEIFDMPYSSELGKLGAQ